MSNWGFSHEKNEVASGANTVAGLVAGQQPFSNADTLRSKRNVIATEVGWVRRQNKTTDGNFRQLDEILVAAHPGPGGVSYAANNHLGFASVAQIWLQGDGSSFANGATVNCYVTFNEPIKYSGLAGTLRIAFANTVGGNNSMVAVSNNVNDANGIIMANNTIVFSFVATPVGTYKIGGQTMANATATAANLVSWNTGNESANLVITGAVSNTLGTFTVV